jgi:hypothetical protein
MARCGRSASSAPWPTARAAGTQHRDATAYASARRTTHSPTPHGRGASCAPPRQPRRYAARGQAQQCLLGCRSLGQTPSRPNAGGDPTLLTNLRRRWCWAELCKTRDPTAAKWSAGEPGVDADQVERPCGQHMLQVGLGQPAVAGVVQVAAAGALDAGAGAPSAPASHWWRRPRPRPRGCVGRPARPRAPASRSGWARGRCGTGTSPARQRPRSDAATDADGTLRPVPGRVAGTTQANLGAPRPVDEHELVWARPRPAARLRRAPSIDGVAPQLGGAGTLDELRQQLERWQAKRLISPE